MIFMKTNKIVIYGVGRFADYATYVFDNDTDYEVVGFCMEQAYLEEHKSIQKNITTFENLENTFSMEDTSIFIAVGNNLIRKRIFKKVKSKGYKFGSYISSKATTWGDLKVGDNCFIGEGSAIQPFVTIEDNTILFVSAIGHHCKIGRNVLLSVCTLGGNVKIGDHSYLGMGSVVKQNINIGEKNIIGMGCVIDKNTASNSVYTSKSATKRSVPFDKVANLFLQ